METRIDEIAAGIYRISIFVPEVAPPLGFTYNHFLILGDEPLLFHCGLRKMFPLASSAVARIIPVDRLRWLTFGHFEADECGSMNEWLAAAPNAQLAHGMVGVRVSIADMADRPPRVLSDGELVDIGGKRLPPWLGCRRHFRGNDANPVLRRLICPFRQSSGAH
jgi:flavorubredoxin